MALIVGSGPGSDNSLGENKIKAYKNFANKVWNIARFVLENTDKEDVGGAPTLRAQDEAYIKELEEILKDITNDLENYRLHLASEKLYHYVWHTFADQILEETKGVLSGDNAEEATSAQWTLRHILRESLKALHPFMPFLTEEIWKDLKNDDEHMLVVSKWPLVE